MIMSLRNSKIMIQVKIKILNALRIFETGEIQPDFELTCILRIIK